MNFKTFFYFSFLLFFSGIILSCGKGERRYALPSGSQAELNRCLSLSANKKYESAIECLEVFKSRYPTGNQAAEAELLIADSYFRQKEYLLAAESYQEFISQYSGHSKVDYAYYRSGMAYYNENPKAIDREQTYLDQAVRSFEQIVRYYPSSPYYKLALAQYKEAKTRQAKKHFYVAKFYIKYGEYLASIPRLTEIITQYAGLGYDEKSFYYLALALHKTKQPENVKKVLVAFEEQFSRSKWLNKAKGFILTGR